MVVENLISYDGKPWTYTVNLMEFRDDKVAHERISPSLTLNEVEVLIQLETRGAEHARTVMDRLRKSGYRVYG